MMIDDNNIPLFFNLLHYSLHALVSISDPTFREATKRVNKLEDLPKVLSRIMKPEAGRGRASEEVDMIFNDEDMARPIHVKVLRPSGTAYTFWDLPGK